MASPPPAQQLAQQQPPAPAAAAAAAAGSAAPSPSPSPPAPLPPNATGTSSAGASNVPQPVFLGPMPLPAPMPPAHIENGRVMERVDKPFVYGSAAFWQGKNVPESQHSHKWTVFLRGLENEDLSYFIEKVSFTLHHSFAEPVRVLYRAPYEVTETGWGEFAIGIQIDFLPISGLEPIVLSHMLKLFPLPNVQPSTKKPVMSEVYDEFVFVNPTKEWFDALHSGPTRKVENHPLTTFFTTPEFAKEEDVSITKLQESNAIVQAHIDQCRVKLFAVDAEIDKLTQKL